MPCTAATAVALRPTSGSCSTVAGTWCSARITTGSTRPCWPRWPPKSRTRPIASRGVMGPDPKAEGPPKALGGGYTVIVRVLKEEHRQPRAQLWLAAGSLCRGAIALKLPGGSGGALAEVFAGGDAEFGEHVAQVPLDGAGADEQVGGDLLVGVPVAGQLGDLGFLGGEVGEGLDCAFAHRFAGG